MRASLSAVLPDATPDILETLGLVEPAPFELRVYGGSPDRSELIERLQGHAVVISDGSAIDESVLAQCRDVRAIVFLGTGLDFYIDRRACERAGVLVEGIGGYGNRTVAEHAFALMIAVYRDLGTQQVLMCRGLWGGRPIGELRGKILGIIGLGGVGLELAQLAAAFGMDVIGWSRRTASAGTCEQVELDELLRRSDVVSLHLAATPETIGFLDGARIAAMKPGAVLINTARAAVVDELALIQALERGHLAGAGLDVFDEEPPAADAPIRSAPNVMLSCHSGWRSPEASRELVRRAFARVREIMLAMA